MKVFKYPLRWRETQVLRAPATMKPLSLQVQHGIPTLWAMIDETASLKRRSVRMLPTGVSVIGHEGAYLGTLQASLLVFHFFLEEENP